MKKLQTLLILLTYLIPISLLTNPQIALAQSCDEQIIRIADPIDPDPTELYWSGKYCKSAQIDPKDRNSIPEDQLKNILSCEIVDFPYSKYPAGCPYCQEGGMHCGLDTGALVGNQCSLVQVKKFCSGVGLLKDFIGDIYTWGAGLGSIAAVLVIIVSGIQYITAGGDSGKVGPAKERIFQSLAALAVLFLAGLILNAINPGFFTSVILFF